MQRVTDGHCSNRNRLVESLKLFPKRYIPHDSSDRPSQAPTLFLLAMGYRIRRQSKIDLKKKSVWGSRVVSYGLGVYNLDPNLNPNPNPTVVDCGGCCSPKNRKQRGILLIIPVRPFGRLLSTKRNALDVRRFIRILRQPRPPRGIPNTRQHDRHNQSLPHNTHLWGYSING